MKPFYLGIIILILLIANDLLAQNSKGLTLEGTVSAEQGTVGGAEIEIYRNGQRLSNVGIASNGRYRLELDYNNEFTLVFILTGNFPQKIVADTRVPQHVLQSDPKFPPFPVNIKLFTEIAGIDKTFSDNPVMKIYYSEKVDNFISDLYYNDTQIKHLIDQAIAQTKRTGRQAGLLEGASKTELAELKKEYERHIRQAEAEYNREEFVAALDGYKAANKIFPKEQYPIDRIAEINDLLGLLMVAEEMEQALKSRLQALLEQADSQFGLKRFEEARASYQRALSIESGNAHALAQLNKIDEIVKKAQNEKEYAALIKAADNSFDELLYAEARTVYLKALELNAAEEYPQQKIKQIDEILRQQVLNAEKLKGYRESIFQAELNFEKQFYDKAISFYENALVHKPGDEVSTNKIREIRELMSQLANRTLYDKSIKAADRAFQRKQYEEALAGYEEAARLMPSEGHPRLRIEQIGSVFAEQERLVAEAEGEKARQAAEAEAVEQARLAALAAEKEARYNKAISSGDSLFSLKDYENSISAYKMALQVKPEEILPARKIKEINVLLGQLAAAQQLYDAAIARGDAAFGQESFEAAKSAYHEAQQAKKEETYPGTMLTRIDSVIEARIQLAAEAEAEKARQAAEAEAAEQARLAALAAEKELEYKRALTRADSLFTLKEYERSRTAFVLAQQLKPEDLIPGQRIAEIDGLMGRLAAAQQVYDAAVERGDAALKEELFEDAKSAYRNAQQAKPEEVYPGDMLILIDSVQQSRAQLAAEAEAVRLRQAAEAEAAEQARMAALAAEKIAKYNQAVSRADSLFSLKEYEGSRIAYLSAQQINPEEALPGQKIAEIDGLLGRLAAAQQAYDAAIARGDVAYKEESFDVARAAYLEAQSAKPDERFPGEMLSAIDSITESRAQLAAKAAEEKARLAAEAEAAEQAKLAALAAEKELKYSQAIFLADSLFGLNDYENSKQAYQQALAVNADAGYPQQKIGELDMILSRLEADRKRQEELREEYGRLIQLANRQFDSHDFAQSITTYEKALKLMPEDPLPTQQIAEANRLLMQKEQDEKYHAIILAADRLYQEEEWEQAKSAYKNAVGIKPDENYPLGQIAKIDNLIKQQAERLLVEKQAAEQAERRKAEIEKQLQAAKDRQEMNDAGLNQIYQEYIALADGFFDRQNYNVSRAWYYKAWDVKQKEVYPRQRIEEINRIVSTLMHSQRDRDYQSFINLADSTFRENQLAAARGWYNRALSLKADESYPKEQLGAIAQLIAERLAGRSEEQFNGHMQQASAAYTTGNYNVARYWLKKALELRPDDIHAKEKLKETEDRLR